MSDLLALDTVSVAYGKRRALDGVSLTVGAGEIVTLLGANGSGKSTTLRAISGLVRPAAGRIRWNGQDVQRWPADAIVAAGIGHVPEGRDVFPEFTVLGGMLAASTLAIFIVPVLFVLITRASYGKKKLEYLKMHHDELMEKAKKVEEQNMDPELEFEIQKSRDLHLADQGGENKPVQG